MRIDGEDDSTGKRKVGALRHRSALLTGALLVGMCLGVLVSEKLYLVTQEAELPEDALAAVRSRKLEVAGGGGAAVLAVADGGVSGGPDGIPRSGAAKPRNELEALLRRVAPQGEVMIAIRWALRSVRLQAQAVCGSLVGACVVAAHLHPLPATMPAATLPCVAFPCSNMNLIHEQSLVMWLEVRGHSGWGRLPLCRLQLSAVNPRMHIHMHWPSQTTPWRSASSACPR